MERIASDDRRSCFLREMAPGEALGEPFGDETYPVLLWAAADTTVEQKAELSAALIASGCRYVVCGGREAQAWEDAVDEAFIATVQTINDINERMVMTAAPEGASPEDLVFYLVHGSRFGAHDFTRRLVLLLGDDPGARAELIRWTRTHVEAAQRDHPS